MASYFNYKIKEFLIESLDKKKNINATSCVSAIRYYEDLFSPAVFVSMLVTNTDGLLSSLPIRGGERVRLIIDQEGTGQQIKFDETKNTFYVYKVYGSTSESTRETMLLELAPAEVFSNETARVQRKYDGNIGQTVSKILKDVLKTTRINEVEKTMNEYSFMGNFKKPFTVLTWLCPKSIPTVDKSSPTAGTAGFLFYENKYGFNFRSVDSLMAAFKLNSTEKKQVPKYTYNETPLESGDLGTNFKILNMPVFEKNVNIFENLRIGMYSSVNYFFDINKRTTTKHVYKLSESYNIMKHAGKTKPDIPLNFDKNPSRLMVKVIDSQILSAQEQEKANKIFDNREQYQSQSVARYNLAFSQLLNITIPLNLNLTVGDVIQLEIGNITKETDQKIQKDTEKSGYYLIKELCHTFEQSQGYTGLKLVRDSYGDPQK